MIHIDIYSDTVCPWCFIGKRRLERTLAAFDQTPVTTTWRPFQLNPEMPPGGTMREPYAGTNSGDSPRAPGAYDAIIRAGAAERINFDFDAIRHTPNTIDSHRLVRYATAHGRQDAVVEALFQGYFVDGEDIGDTAVLGRIARTHGLDGAAVDAYLASDKDRDEIAGEDLRARRMGINAVPCFIVDGRYAISGAQEPEAFFPLLELAEIGKIAAE